MFPQPRKYTWVVDLSIEAGYTINVENVTEGTFDLSHD